jgi:hypothetical protein
MKAYHNYVNRVEAEEWVQLGELFQGANQIFWVFLDHCQPALVE